MSESTLSADKSRCQRLCRGCEWCGSLLPESARSDAKYCGAKCRYNAAIDRAHTGRISRVSELKGGRISVVVYMDSTDLRPGQNVKVGLDTGD